MSTSRKAIKNLFETILESVVSVTHKFVLHGMGMVWYGNVGMRWIVYVYNKR